ncbi:MAG TPA: hypothetical protein VKA97_05200 [Pyrinomonadaceae bacterium]|nr:hypothetical protein [Pyrinomonadaceae bacterium]
MSAYEKLFYVLLGAVALASFACSGNNENSHTTVTTYVPPPPHQVLRAETRSGRQLAGAPNPSVDVNKPLLVFNLPNGQTFREGEEVVIDFSLASAKLKGDGGDFRVRYFVDDDEMQWIDRWEQVALSGWVPGKHTIRLELIGPDGWPVRDTIVTREIMVVK